MFYLKAINIRKFIVPSFCMLFIFLLIVYSDVGVDSALKGLNLWLNVVFPSLFPFFVASNILNTTGFVKVFGILMEPIMRPLFNVCGCGSFAFLMGITSGYPVGAKITAEMRKGGLITSEEAGRLLAFSNNSGPLFIMGAVAVGMFKEKDVGIILYICHIAACVTVGILLGFISRVGRKSSRKIMYKTDKQHEYKLLQDISSAQGRDERRDFGSLLGNAVRDSIASILMIGGFIILFSVIINMLFKTQVIKIISDILKVVFQPLKIKEDLITSLVSGFFEITTGTNLAASASESSIAGRLAAASMIIGWAGLSVHFQVLSIITGTGISIGTYLKGKFLHGILAAVYTIALNKIFPGIFARYTATFAGLRTLKIPSWSESLSISLKCLLTAIIISLIIFSAMIIHRMLFPKQRH